MRKIVINNGYGGYNLSDEAVELYMKLSGKAIERHEYKKKTFGFDHWYDFEEIQRDDPFLVQVVETLKSRASGSSANLAIAEIPEEVEWGIDEYDGWESVEEVHRSWGPTTTFERPKYTLAQERLIDEVIEARRKLDAPISREHAEELVDKMIESDEA